VSRVLLTGAGGYVARLAARRLLAEGADLVLWLSACDEAEAAGKRDRTAVALGRAADDRRLAWAWGDLREDDPFARAPRDGIDCIVHAAAVTRFNVEAELAEAVNHRGTRKALAFAATLPRLERFVQVSTIYAGGLAAGEVREEPAEAPAGFANHYEASKHAAEQAVAQSGLPATILRLATIVADGDDGASLGQQNAVHNTLKLLRHGLLPLLPGRPDTPLYFISGATAAEAIVAAALAAAPPAFVHVAHRRAQSLTVAALIECVLAAFGRDPAFRARRVLAPPYVEADAFELMASGLDGAASPVVAQALRSLAPFARQLYVAKDVRNDGLLRLVGRDPAPDPRRLMDGVCTALAAPAAA
jgi:nucleoside-diphosphate-sugar epimerase